VDVFLAVGAGVSFAIGVDSGPHPQKSRTSENTKARNGFIIGPLFGLIIEVRRSCGPGEFPVMTLIQYFP
ncbi:MAG: hypothetical protein COA78_14605, partial [Blastopirellula sp.]